MKRKALTVLGLVLLFSLIVIWLRGHHEPFLGGFSPGDVKEIQSVIRHDLWQRAFTHFSIASSSRLLWTMATSRVKQIDVSPDNRRVLVLVHSALGDSVYDMHQDSSQNGPTRWRISSLRPAGPWLKQVEFYGTFAKLSINGGLGLGLTGEKLPPSFDIPPPHPIPPVSPSPEIFGPAARSRQDSVHSTAQFSESLSNVATLQLRIPQRPTHER
jgi:hypothetical protein